MMTAIHFSVRTKKIFRTEKYDFRILIYSLISEGNPKGSACRFRWKSIDFEGSETSISCEFMTWASKYHRIDEFSKSSIWILRDFWWFLQYLEGILKSEVFYIVYVFSQHFEESSNLVFSRFLLVFAKMWRVLQIWIFYIFYRFYWWLSAFSIKMTVAGARKTAWWKILVAHRYRGLVGNPTAAHRLILPG